LVVFDPVAIYPFWKNLSTGKFGKIFGGITIRGRIAEKLITRIHQNTLMFNLFSTLIF